MDDQDQTSFGLEDPTAFYAQGPFRAPDIGAVAMVESHPYYGYARILVGPKTPSNRHQYPGLPPFSQMFKYLSLLSAPLQNKNSKPYVSPQNFAAYSMVNSQLNRLYGSVSGPVPPIGLNFGGS